MVTSIPVSRFPRQQRMDATSRSDSPGLLSVQRSETFVARVTGNNMGCTRAVTIYTPLEGEQQRDAKFTGRHRDCEFVNQMVLDAGSRRAQCDYRCSCGGDVCSAVYLFVIDKSLALNIELCSIEFN